MDDHDCISLNTACALTGISKRTLWRRIADGSLPACKSCTSDKTLVSLAVVRQWAQLPLADEDLALVLAADHGEAEAQCDLGLLFLAAERPAEAVDWLERAARHYYPEAMYWLGRCLVAGLGVAPDEAAGLAWLRKAADHGHTLARHALAFLHDPAARLALGAHSPAALDAALDAVERRAVAAMLAG